MVDLLRVVSCNAIRVPPLSWPGSDSKAKLASCLIHCSMSLGTCPRFLPCWSSYCLDCDILSRSQWKMHDPYVQRGNPPGKEPIVLSNEPSRCPRCTLSPSVCLDSRPLANHRKPVHCPVVQTFSSSNYEAERYLSIDNLCNYTFNNESATRTAMQVNDDYAIGSTGPGHGALDVKFDARLDGSTYRPTEHRERSKSV